MDWRRPSDRARIPGFARCWGPPTPSRLRRRPRLRRATESRFGKSACFLKSARLLKVLAFLLFKAAQGMASARKWRARGAASARSEREEQRARGERDEQRAFRMASGVVSGREPSEREEPRARGAASARTRGAASARSREREEPRARGAASARSREREESARSNERGASAMSNEREGWRAVSWAGATRRALHPLGLCHRASRQYQKQKSLLTHAGLPWVRAEDPLRPPELRHINLVDYYSR